MPPASRRWPRHPRVWWSRIKHRWPFLVWVAAIVALWRLYGVGVRTVRFPGVVEALREDAAPVETARLISLHVAPGQEVLPGDVLARFDASLADAQFAVERLQAERQFAGAAERIAARLRDLKMRQASDQQRLNVLRAESDRLRELLAVGVEEAARLAYLRAEQEALAKVIELYPPAIREVEQEMAAAQAREEAARQWLASASDPESPSAEPPPAGMEDLAQTFSLLRARRESFILRARHTGTVTRIWFQPGDVVPAGTPTVTLLFRGEQRVTGFLWEYIARAVSAGMDAFVAPASDAGFGRLYGARIEHVSPDVSCLPTRASPIRNQPFRGRRVTVTLAEPMDLLPGEAVNIFIGRPWWSEWSSRHIPGEWMEWLRRFRRRFAFSASPAPATPPP